MKFICKDVWTYLFQQPATRLQADKHGGFSDGIMTLCMIAWACGNHCVRGISN